MALNWWHCSFKGTEHNNSDENLVKDDNGNYVIVKTEHGQIYILYPTADVKYRHHIRHPNRMPNVDWNEFRLVIVFRWLGRNEYCCSDPKKPLGRARVRQDIVDVLKKMRPGERLLWKDLITRHYSGIDFETELVWERDYRKRQTSSRCRASTRSKKSQSNTQLLM